MSLVVSGVAAMRLNGKPVIVKGEMTINLGTPVREALEVATGPVGYKQRAGTPMIEFETIKERNVSLEELATLSDVTVTVTLIDGTTYAFESAWVEGDGNLTTEEGTISLVIKALSAKEVSPS